MPRNNVSTVLGCNGVKPMALKRIISDQAVDEKTYEKLLRELDFLPPGHGDRGRITAELNTTKARMASRR